MKLAILYSKWISSLRSCSVSVNIVSPRLSAVTRSNTTFDTNENNSCSIEQALYQHLSIYKSVLHSLNMWKVSTNSNIALDQWFSTGGPQKSLCGQPNLSHFVSKYNFIHNYYKFYKNPNFLAIQASRKDKISQF